MKRKSTLVGILVLALGLSLTWLPELGWSYSSKEAKEKVDAAEKGLQEAKRAGEKWKQADDDRSKKRGAAFEDALNRDKKAEEARAAREKADETGKESDIKAAEKAEKIAEAARKKSEESEKALEAATQALIQARMDQEVAKNKVPPLIESAEKAVEELPESSVKKKLKERIKKVKDDLKQLAVAPRAPGTVETASGHLGFFPAQLDPNKVAMSLAGTKETIGHVATLTLVNHTDETFPIHIPPTILASKTGRVQNYSLTEEIETTLGPRQTQAIPLTGVCLDARVPPAGPEDKDELQLLDPDTLSPEQVAYLAGTQTVIQTTEELQSQGAYHTPFSSQPQKERDTLIQWTTWLFVSTMQGKPVTKEEMAQKVYEQVGELTPEKKTKLEPGIDDLWNSVQLTGMKAKLVPPKTERISDQPEEAPQEEAPKEKPEDVLKRLGWVQGPDGKWRPPTKPGKPEPPRWQEVVDQTGRRGIRSPDGKTVYEGEEGYEKAQEELEKQKQADAEKAASEEQKKQEEAQKKAEQDAKSQAAADGRQREKENLQKRKEGDVNAWNEWVQQNPGRQKVPIRRQDGTPTGKYNYFDEQGKLVAENIPG